MEVTYYPNFDYEFELAGAPVSKMRNQVVERFEWLALLGMDEGRILLSQVYPQEYLDHLLTFKKLPEIVRTALVTRNWWGELSDLELEKTLNSKVFAAQLARDILGFEFEVHRAGEKILNGRIGKKEFSVSGRGLVSSEATQGLNEVAFTEPLYERVIDLGSRYKVINGEWTLIQRSLNEIDSQFNFRGARLSRSQNFQHDLEVHDTHQLAILAEVTKRFGSKVRELQMDSFLYRENLKILPKAICEFNYRRSIVSVIYHFMEVTQIDSASWLMRALKPLDLDRWLELGEFLAQRSAILLSPPRARDLAILFKEDCEFDRLKIDLAHKFSIEL